jgi:hypothetical protein
MTTEETWRVQLPTGELRAFSLDALDEAFNAGLIHGGTLVLAPGETTWAPLSIVAGLDAPEAESVSTTPSLSPVAISYDAPQYASYPPPVTAAHDLADLSEDALKPKRGRAAIFATLGVAAIAACGFALAPKLGKVLGNVHPDRMSAANAMQAPPPAVDVTGDGYKPTSTLTEEQKRLLVEADKRKEEERKKREEAAAKAREAKRPAGKRGKSSSPFVNSGDKFDPLNGAL